MHTESFGWNTPTDFDAEDLPLIDSAQLVLLFCSGDITERWQPVLATLAEQYTDALIVGCSSAGEIHDVTVRDGALVGTAIRFADTQVRGALAETREGDTRAAAQQLSTALSGDALRYVMVFSDGLAVNGSELAAALHAGLPDGVLISGGLAGDGADFNETYVIYDGRLHSGAVAAVGFYGERLSIGHGSLGGWDPFGPTRTVTRSAGNVLYELDNQSALDLYKAYLGDYAAELPASGLLFPLSVSLPGGEESVVRTLLAIDEQDGSMTFAGDLPSGARAKLMKANFDRLVDGAMNAAQQALARAGGASSLALLVSCVGRKMVLGDRIEEEVDAVRDVLGDAVRLIGFYSYGELSPVVSGNCELHNQTMTITTLSEA